jgi:nucleoside-diphosphate-sugar epimerase
VVNILTKKAVEGQKLSVFGGEQWRPLLHVRDVGNAFLYCFQNNISGLYNLAAHNMKIVELAEVIKKVIPDAQIEYKDMKFEDLRNYRVTNFKIRQTGWRPTLELEDGILELQKVFRENRITNLNDPVYSNQAFIKNKFGKKED